MFYINVIHVVMLYSEADLGGHFLGSVVRQLKPPNKISSKTLAKICAWLFCNAS